jgi:DNA topoisomerase VI B subunit
MPPKRKRRVGTDDGTDDIIVLASGSEEEVTDSETTSSEDVSSEEEWDVPKAKGVGGKKKSPQNKRKQASAKTNGGPQKRAAPKKAAPKKATGTSSKKTGKGHTGERAEHKSAAAFFAENQNIAGFDNHGKALYTTVRELVENSLDAAESIQVCPSIQLLITELTQKQFDVLRGSKKRERTDNDLYDDREIDEKTGRYLKKKKSLTGTVKPTKPKGKQSAFLFFAGEMRSKVKTELPKLAFGEVATEVGRRWKALTDEEKAPYVKMAKLDIERHARETGIMTLEHVLEDDSDVFAVPTPSQSILSSQAEPSQGSQASASVDNASGAGSEAGDIAASKKVKRGPKNRGFYRITCRDNGMGMPTDKVGDMLGRVLSGSKYGLRQTRGKFGLGAKMALIWAKKSTGIPIRIRTAYAVDGGTKPGPTVSDTTLDIDILKNEPILVSQNVVENTDGWRGTEFSVVIEGNWMWAKSQVQRYISSMAVVTPFAEFTLKFHSEASSAKSFELKYERRDSAQIPPPAQTVEYHPRSVNQLTVQQLLDQVEKSLPLWKFLNTKFQSISTPLAKKLVAELRYDSKIKVKDIVNDENQVHDLTKLLTEARFPDPDGKCLSPAGVYNLKLGILKEFFPDAYAAAASKVHVFEGHPFIVEAGVCIGGHTREGISVYRFANRIPMLLMEGSDVSSVVARNDIKWSTYHINKQTDKIGVFVSIVSTKIPFKGTGKEFIGKDNKVYKDAITRTIRACCNDLKHTLKNRKVDRANAARTASLSKFVPSVCKSVMAVLHSMNAAREASADFAERHPLPKEAKSLLSSIKSGKLTTKELELKLKESIVKHDQNELARVTQKMSKTMKDEDRVDLFLRPINTMDRSKFSSFDLKNTAYHTPNISFRLLSGVLPDVKDEDGKWEVDPEDEPMVLV